MDSINDQHLFDLAMKSITHQATDAERAELETLLNSQPDLRTTVKRLEEDARMTKDALLLVEATQLATKEPPAYVRRRLQTKVWETLGRSGAEKKSNRKLAWGWMLGLTATAAAVVIVAVSFFHMTGAPAIQLAMLDVMGDSRGLNTNEITLLRTAYHPPRWMFSRVQMR